MLRGGRQGAELRPPQPPGPTPNRQPQLDQMELEHQELLAAVAKLDGSLAAVQADVARHVTDQGKGGWAAARRSRRSRLTGQVLLVGAP